MAGQGFRAPEVGVLIVVAVFWIVVMAALGVYIVKRFVMSGSLSRTQPESAQELVNLNKQQTMSRKRRTEPRAAAMPDISAAPHQRQTIERFRFKSSTFKSTAGAGTQQQ